MQPDKTLVIDVGHLHDETLHCNKATYRDRYANASYYADWSPPSELFARFLRGLDVVFTAETFYSDEFVALARDMGVRTVQQANFEFLPYITRDLPKPDILAMPSRWRWDEIPEPKTHLPVPIALDRFTPRISNPGPRHFLHVVGRPAICDRNGTPDVLTALHHVKSDIKLTVRCQDRDYLASMMNGVIVPPNVELTLDSGDVRDYWDNYTDGDVLILPRRYGGLCLPANEALGAGMPVIMTDIDPNNTWIPGDWLVPARQTGSFHAMNRVDVFEARREDVAAKIDQFSDDEFFDTARIKAGELAKQYSWDNLKPEYEKVLRGD